MKKAPSLYFLEHLPQITKSCSAEINGRWVPARPIGLFGFWSRISHAWMVFTGEADVLIWPEGQ